MSQNGKSFSELVGKARHIDVGMSQCMNKPKATIIVKFEEYYNQPLEEKPKMQLTFDGAKKTATIEFDGKSKTLDMAVVLDTLINCGEEEQ